MFPVLVLPYMYTNSKKYEKEAYLSESFAKIR